MIALLLALSLASEAAFLTQAQHDQMLAHKQRAVEHFERLRYLEAAEAFVAAEKIAYGDELLLKDIANSYYMAGRYGAANDHFGEIIRLKIPLPPQGWRKAARSFAVEGLWPETEKAAAAGLAAQPGDEELIDWQALARYARGRAFEETYLEWSGLSKRHGMHRFYTGLSDLLASSALQNRNAGGRYGELFTLALLYRLQADCWSQCHWQDAENRPSPDALYRIAALYVLVPAKPLPSATALRLDREARGLAADNWGAAAEAYRRAVIDSPWWPEAHYNHAVARFAASEDIGPAIQSLRHYLAFEPSGERAKTARRLLKKWEKASR